MKYKQYQKMKDSGIEWIGEIPEHWEIKRLKFVLEDRISDGPHETPEFVDVGIPFLSVDNIQDDKLYLENLRYISKVDHERFSLKCKPKKNDILLGKAASVGKVALVDLDLDFNIWSPLAVIRVSQNKMSPQFTYFLMKSDFLQTQISLKVNWNTQGNIGMGDIKNLFILQPPYDEEKQIENFLDKETTQFDDLISKSQSQVNFLQEKRQAVIDQSLTKGLDPTVPMKDSGVEWIGDIPEHWNVMRLKMLTNNIISGPFGSSLKKEVYTSSGFRIYGQEQVIPADFSIGDYYISEQKFNEMKKYAVSPGDILFSCVGTFGKTAIVPPDIEPGIINPRLIKITTNNKYISPEFLRLLMKSHLVFSQMEKISRGGTMGVMNIELLSSLTLTVPPTIEQNQICELIDIQDKNYETLTSKSQSQIKILQEKRQTLITAAVTGKIDVRK